MNLHGLREAPGLGLGPAPPPTCRRSLGDLSKGEALLQGDALAAACPRTPPRPRRVPQGPPQKGASSEKARHRYTGPESISLPFQWASELSQTSRTEWLAGHKNGLFCHREHSIHTCRGHGKCQIADSMSSWSWGVYAATAW